MLYFYEGELYKSKDKLSIEYETFQPTDDLEEGWLLYYDYRTYDSYNIGDSTYYEILELYDSEEKAVQNAEKLNEMRKYGYNGEMIVSRNSGSEPKHTGLGWGVDCRKIVVKKIKVKSEYAPDIQVWEY